MPFIINGTKIKWHNELENERTKNDMLSQYDYSNNNYRKIRIQVTTTKQYTG